MYNFHPEAYPKNGIYFSRISQYNFLAETSPKLFKDKSGYPGRSPDSAGRGDIPGYPDLWDIPSDISTLWDNSSQPDLTRLILYLSHWY
jgi:hypothetical protein